MTHLHDVAALAEELCDPRPHLERIPFWDAHRNRKYRLHTVTLPGLLAQLHASVYDTTSAVAGRPSPASKPPLALQALSLHTEITIAAARWCWSLRLQQRDTVEGNIRALVGAAATLDSDTAATLLTEMRSWRHQAAVATGWRAPLYAPRVPCPVCDKVATIRINLAAQAAFCTDRACQATWDETTIGLLADHIRHVTGDPA